MRRILVTAGMVGIFVLGAAFWTALGVMFFSWKDAQSSLPAVFPTSVLARAATPAPAPAIAAVPSATPTSTRSPSPTPQATAAPTPTAMVIVAANPPPVATNTPVAAVAEGRAPWVLLPQPEAGAKVRAGQLMLEVRARGDAPIASIRLELDGSPVATSVEPRSDVIWRGWGTATVKAGQHTARATVTDSQGRSGGYRWSFEATP